MTRVMHGQILGFALDKSDVLIDGRDYVGRQLRRDADREHPACHRHERA